MRAMRVPLHMQGCTDHIGSRCPFVPHCAMFADMILWKQVLMEMRESSVVHTAARCRKVVFIEVVYAVATMSPSSVSVCRDTRALSIPRHARV